LNSVPAGGALDRFARAVRMLSQLCGFIAAALVALAVVIVCEMVFVRYVLNQSTIWQTDFITYCITAATFIGSPYVLMTRGHVNVDVLPHYAGPRLRFALAVAASVVTLALAVALFILTTLFWKEALFQGPDMRRAQLQLFEHLRRAHGLVGQLGVTTAGMDGPALMGLPTLYLTEAPNPRLGTWVGAVPGYREIVRGAAHFEQISRALRCWAAEAAAPTESSAA